MLGLLKRLHRLQVQFTIQADANSGIIFPRLLKNQSKEGKNAMKKCCLSEVTNEKILSAVEKAEGDAKKAMEKLGMAKLLHKHSMWESTQVLSIECDDSDDSEDDCDDENDANQQENKQEIVSSLIQEVCCDEPQLIAADIKNLIDNKVVDNSIHTVFENQHKLLSFKRISSITIPMYDVIDAENKKGTKSKQNFSPFVEIRSHKGTFL